MSRQIGLITNILQCIMLAHQAALKIHASPYFIQTRALQHKASIVQELDSMHLYEFRTEHSAFILAEFQQRLQEESIT